MWYTVLWEGYIMDDTLQYQVYEVTYERSYQTRKTVLQSGLSKQEARELARKHRNSQEPPNLISKRIGFEEMDLIMG